MKKVDEWGLLERHDYGRNLREHLAERFALPLASDEQNPSDLDLGLDVLIPKYRSGDSWFFELGEIGFPVFWRPRVEVKSRLYFLKSGKTTSSFSTTEKMRYGEYLSRLLTWRGFFRHKPVFDSSDLEELVDKACARLINQMKIEV